MKKEVGSDLIGAGLRNLQAGMPRSRVRTHAVAKCALVWHRYKSAKSGHSVHLRLNTAIVSMAAPRARELGPHEGVAIPIWDSMLMRAQDGYFTLYQTGVGASGKPKEPAKINAASALEIARLTIERIKQIEERKGFSDMIAPGRESEML